VSPALTLIGTAGLGTNERLRRALAFGHVCHVQTVALDLRMQMLAPILAHTEAMRPLERIEREGLQLAAVGAPAVNFGTLSPVPRRLGRMLAAGE
jgi:hypothetical protein